MFEKIRSQVLYSKEHGIYCTNLSVRSRPSPLLPVKWTEERWRFDSSAHIPVYASSLKCKTCKVRNKFTFPRVGGERREAPRHCSVRCEMCYLCVKHTTCPPPISFFVLLTALYHLPCTNSIFCCTAMTPTGKCWSREQ